MDENDISGLQATFFGMASGVTQTLKLRNSLAMFMYNDVRPEVLDPSRVNTIDMIIPRTDPNNVKDIGYGAVEPSNYGYDNVTVTISKHWDVTKAIGDFVQTKSSYDLNLLLQTMGEEMLRKINTYLAETIFIPANFDYHTVIAGAGANLFQRADFMNAWINLTTIGVQTEELFFLTDNGTFQRTLQADEFSKADYVGEVSSRQAQAGVWINTLGIPAYWDQAIQVAEAGKYAGYLGSRFANVNLFRLPLAPPPGSGVIATTMTLGAANIPVQWRTWYDPNSKTRMVGLSTLQGCTTARPELMQAMKTA